MLLYIAVVRYLAMGNLKLYVWEGVLTDYTSGIAFAIAETVEQARQVIYDKSEKQDGYVSSTLIADIAGEPIVCENTEGFYVWGGG